MTESTDHLVFVYGTLKRGEPNQHEIMPKEDRAAQFLGCGETMEKYPLVIASDWNIPFLLKVENQGHCVKGEIYRVNDKMLKYLDWFESHPTLYLRQEASVSLTQDKDGNEVVPPVSMQCGIYFLVKASDDLLKLNYLSDYKSAENPPYISRVARGSDISVYDMIFPTTP